MYQLFACRKLLLTTFSFFILFGKLFGSCDCECKVTNAAFELYVEGEPYVVTKMGGGLTNQNYKVSSPTASYFFRCGDGSNELLGASLDREWQATSEASRLGLAPSVVFYSFKDRLLATSFIDKQGRKVDAHDIVTMGRLAQILSVLHKSDICFSLDFCPFKMIDNYLQLVAELDIALPDIFSNIVMPRLALLKQVADVTLKKVPCHIDFHRGNVLDDGQNLWVIDWEYAGMADPFFDLASFASLEHFSDVEMIQLLAFYLPNGVSNIEFNYLRKMRVVADAYWSLWFYLQSQLSSLNFPFRKYGDLYLKNCLIRCISNVEEINNHGAK